jgi:hypothetical protein
MSGDDFDWSADSADVVQREVPSVAVYPNVHGQICIRQQRTWDDEEDACLIVAPYNAARIADAIRRTAVQCVSIAPEPAPLQARLPAPVKPSPTTGKGRSPERQADLLEA